jgi:copper(I)-binding protein
MKLKALALIVALSCGAVYAQGVEVKDAWVRATVSGQKATGAFMKITAKEGAKLIASSSPAAGVTEVHEMKMDGGVMKMRAVEGGLDLPAGKAVELKPGGYHVMLIDLVKPLEKGATVPVTLTVVGKDGKKSTLEVKAEVRAPGGAPPMKH